MIKSVPNVKLILKLLLHRTYALFMIQTAWLWVIMFVKHVPLDMLSGQADFVKSLKLITVDHQMVVGL